VWTAEAVLVCALTLLGRGLGSFPPIDLVATLPADVTPAAEAFVRINSGRISLVTTSSTFRRLQQVRDQCGDTLAARKLASILIHEEMHVKQGADEKNAYLAQLTTLTALGSGIGSPPYQEVVRAMRHTLAQRRSAPERVMVIAEGP
jgi:hypothetical protein